MSGRRHLEYSSRNKQHFASSKLICSSRQRGADAKSSIFVDCIPKQSQWRVLIFREARLTVRKAEYCKAPLAWRLSISNLSAFALPGWGFSLGVPAEQPAAQPALTSSSTAIKIEHSTRKWSICQRHHFACLILSICLRFECSEIDVRRQIIHIVAIAGGAETILSKVWLHWD